ncbi:MAG: 5-oxoprolinase subunit PxpB [Bacteroidota bacterium]
MSVFPLVVKPFGETAVLMEWPHKVDEQILKDILHFQQVLKKHLDKDWVMVPAYNSLTLIHPKADFDFTQLKAQLIDWYHSPKSHLETANHLWRLPVCYDAAFGIDLEATAGHLGMTVEELITLHGSTEYTVYGIGFLPGFMYLGGLPKALETPRQEVPRLLVPKGSVGLAGKQTGIYPQDSPGGWNIIGRCPAPLFNVAQEAPYFVNVGDKIQFIPVERAEYDLRLIEAQVGIYKPDKVVRDA